MPHAVDESPMKDINFSRKRPITAVRTSSESAGDNEVDINGQTRTPKRVRSTQQLNTDEVSIPPVVQTLKAQRKHASPSASLSRRHASNSGRNSKFKEASMHDRVSEKPPSMFMRVFGGGHDHSGQEVDQMMEDYHTVTDSPVRLRSVTRHGAVPRPVTRQTQMVGLTHHANTEISTTSATTSNTNDSGIYRFGRSIASAFNPFKAWKSMQRSLKSTEDELLFENAQKAKEAEAAERMVQIQVAYDELKRSGQIPTKTVVRPVTSKGIRPGDRDSGIQLSSTRSSADMRTSFYDNSARGSHDESPKRPESRKAAFHVRRPSLNDLKNLHARFPSASPQKKVDQTHGEDYVQTSVTKKNLAKQQKLTKQVSNLETKLEKAKDELYNAMSEPRPLPKLPGQPEQSPGKLKAAFKPSSLTRKSRGSMVVPGLESIPSERLLLKKGNMESSSDLSFKCQGEAQQQPIFEPELMTVEEKRQSTSERSFLSDPSDDEATPKPRKDALMADLAVAQMSMINTPQSSKDATAEAEVVESPVLGSPAKQLFRKARKRKSRDEEATYKPTPDRTDEDDTEWNEAAKKKSKKTKSSSTGSKATRSKAARSTVVAVDEVPEAAMDTSVTGMEDPFYGTETNEVTPMTDVATELPFNRPLSMINEETASMIGSIAVSLNTEPDRPTAVKTPAAYPSRVSHSRMASLDKSPNRGRRSQSPPPSSAYSKRTDLDGEEVRVAPDGVNVPPVPGSTPTRGRAMNNEPGSPFQWPEDCF